MRHTKKNRKQRRNGKNKKRFSKKHIGGLGLADLANAINKTKDYVGNTTKAISELNSPLSILNRQLKSGQNVGASKINTVNSLEYNKIEWKWKNPNNNYNIEVRPYVTLDGVEALLNKANEYLNSKPYESAEIGKDIALLTDRINELKELGKKTDNTPIEDMLSTKLIRLDVGVSDDELKEMFIEILTTGGVNHLTLFKTKAKKIINFDDFTNNDGDTAFMMIASNPNPELLSYVLDPKNEIKNKINFGTNKKNGQNILHIAANNKNPKIMQIIFDETAGIKDKIIENGFINPKTNNEYKNLPIDILCNNNENIGEEYIENIKLLIDNRSNFYTAYDIIKTKINDFTLLTKSAATDAKKMELNNKLQNYIEIMNIFDIKKDQIITECSKSLESKYKNEAVKQTIIEMNKGRWMKLNENNGREQITETEKPTFDSVFTTKLKDLIKNDTDVFKNYPCDLVIDDNVEDTTFYPKMKKFELLPVTTHTNSNKIGISSSSNTNSNKMKKFELPLVKTTDNTKPNLKQGGRRRVTKRLQHNLRRYKL